MKVLLNNREDLLIINEKQRTVIAISDIIMLKGFINYTYFYLQNGRYRLSARTLKHYEALLKNKGFIRVHRAFIVNRTSIIEPQIFGSRLLLKEGYEAEISRRRKNELLKLAY